MRALKWILGGAAALALVVMLAGYIYLSGMDFNSLKPKLARAVEQGNRPQAHHGPATSSFPFRSAPRWWWKR